MTPGLWRPLLRRAILAASLAAVLTACAGGPKVALDPESAAFYESARLIMTAEERAIFNRLPDAESRREFERDFWAKRDPDPDTETNEYRTEFEARVEYANSHFHEGGPGRDTDRGRVYIFMGPPDKRDEYFSHGDPAVRGSIIHWVYYQYALLIEFVDAQGGGQYRMRTIDGDFWGAMESLKLGQSVRADDVFLKKFVDFDLRYDAAAGEVTVLLPAGALSFKNDGSGRPSLDLAFKVYVYEDEGARKRELSEERTFATTEKELLDLEEVAFTFPLTLAPGTSYIDVIVTGRQSRAGDKIRKIFKVKA